MSAGFCSFSGEDISYNHTTLTGDDMDHFSEIPETDLLFNLNSHDVKLYTRTIRGRGVWGYLESEGVALRGHFVYTAGGHGQAYINIRDLSTIQQLLPIAIQMAWECRHLKLNGIVGTPHGADALAVLVAYYYTQFTKNAVEIFKPLKGDSGLVWYKDHGERVRDKQILQVEDVINSAKSLRETADFITTSQGRLVGIIATCNRISEKNPGLVAISEEFHCSFVHALTDVEVDNYTINLSHDPREQCPLCTQGVPVDTRVGHGKAFLVQIQNLYPDLYMKLTQ